MERSKSTFRNRAKILAVICLLALLSLGGTLAYMTDHESAENRFTVGKVDFNLYERNWDGERADGTYATSSNAMLFPLSQILKTLKLNISPGCPAKPGRSTKPSRRKTPSPASPRSTRRAPGDGAGAPF